MKKSLLIFGLIAHSSAFASGVPVVHCTSLQAGLVLTFSLDRTDEELGQVMGTKHENNSYSTLSGDANLDYGTSLTISRKGAPDTEEALAEIGLPAGDSGAKYTQGFHSRTYFGKKKSLETFVALSQQYTNAYGEEFGLRLVASNQGSLSQPKMSGFMELVVTPKTRGTVRKEIKTGKVKVVCESSWE